MVATVATMDADGDDGEEPETDPEGESSDDTQSQDSRSTVDSGANSPSRACTSGLELEMDNFSGPDSNNSAYEGM